MLTYEQLSLLRDVGAAVAFDDERHGIANELVIGRYLKKVGDLYELTPDGEMALQAHGAIQPPQQQS